MKQIELKRRTRTVAVPTTDADVKARFRLTSEFVFRDRAYFKLHFTIAAHETNKSKLPESIRIPNSETDIRKSTDECRMKHLMTRRVRSFMKVSTSSLMIGWVGFGEYIVGAS